MEEGIPIFGLGAVFRWRWLAMVSKLQRLLLVWEKSYNFMILTNVFPAWGFGGNVSGSISHYFNLNGNPYADEFVGVEGIMNAYSSSLHNVALAGRTLFGQVIHRAAGIAAQSQDSSKYYELLLITDGVITDLQETIAALVKESNLPLSNLIVGVGNADFTQMEIIAADTRLHSSTHQVAKRDIVQFVPINNVQLGARNALALLGTMLGFYLVRVLPSKTATAPVKPTFLPISADEREMCSRTVYCANIDKKVTQAEVNLFFETLWRGLELVLEQKVCFEK